MIFVLLRFAFAAYLVSISLRAAHAAHPEFLPLAGFAALGMAYASITTSTLSGFQYWWVTGLVLASLHTTRPDPLPATDKRPATKRVLPPRPRKRRPNAAAHNLLQRK